MLEFMNVASISARTFYRHARSYVNPVIIQQWREHQQQLLNSLREKEDGLVLAGDGRCDSPGYSAKFGSYTLMEQQVNRVVDFQLVQVGAKYNCVNYFNLFHLPVLKLFPIFFLLNFGIQHRSKQM